MKSRDRESLNRLLEYLQPGEMPLDVFVRISRLVVTPVVEIVATMGCDKLILIKRPASDTLWPEKYCLPGKIISPRHGNLMTSVSDALQKIKIASVNSKICPKMVNIQLINTSRGYELALVYHVDVSSILCNTSMIFDWANIENVDLIQEHRDILCKNKNIVLKLINGSEQA
jgi:hypothetical protein